MQCVLFKSGVGEWEEQGEGEVEGEGDDHHCLPSL